MSKILLYAKVARAQTLVMSIGPLISYYLYCKFNYLNSDFNKLSFILTGVSIVLFHLSVNTISEYRDCQKGVDDPNSPGTKYRLISGIVPRKHILYLGVTAFSIAAIVGLFAVCLSSIYLLIPGILGAGIALFYSEWPFGFKYKALGEIGVFMAYGPLSGFAAIFSLTGNFSLNDFLFSIPFGLFTTCVLIANNIRDHDFDLGKTKTLTTIYGIKFSYAILFFIAHLGFSFIPILVYLHAIPNYGFLAFLAYSMILLSIKQLGTPKFIDMFGMLQVIYCQALNLAFLIYT